MEAKKVLKIEAEFLTECLGTNPSDPNVYASWIAEEAPDRATTASDIAGMTTTMEVHRAQLRAAAEANPNAPAVEEVEDANLIDPKGKTIFLKTEDGKPYLPAYMIKGFLKSSAKAQNRIPGSRVSGIKANQQVITDLIFVTPAKVMLELPSGATIGELQRPLCIANSPTGPRTAISVSESVPVGTKFKFQVEMLRGDLEPLAKDLLDYGERKGIGQWRNAGKGSFSYRIV